MSTILNIAAYKFAPLSDLKPLRERLLTVCNEWNLKGTILLSPEGINLFVAGTQEEIDILLKELRSIPGLENLTPKYSESRDKPFNRMLVRLKKEIIAFGVEGIAPEKYTSRKLPARDLKQWLDEGREVTLLDTRNDYEYKLGTFRNALTFDLQHFRNFPDVVRQLPEEMKEKPIVMFCTGGIRCEKAGPFMEKEGFQNIFQLEGGILKYFEEVGGAHYEGECFVFDHRVGLDPALQETDSVKCFKCSSPLTVEDQKSPQYVISKSCPYCFEKSLTENARNLAQRQARLNEMVTPLPGSRPQDNRRPIKVPQDCDGFTLVDFLSTVLDHVPRDVWVAECQAGLWESVDGEKKVADHRVKAGERYLHLQTAMIEPDVATSIELLYEDAALLILNKPAPLPMHPSGRFHRNTLQNFLEMVYGPAKPRPAHRLDANTSGLVACARTRYFAGLLQSQFAEGQVEKVYRVRVIGQPSWETLTSTAPISREAAIAGSRDVDEEFGLAAETEFRVIERNTLDKTTWLEARPRTGRTNQIRVHLWDIGFPIVGDPVYLPERKLGEIQTLRPEDPPMCLQASELAFLHPISKELVRFNAPVPAWWRLVPCACP